MNHILTNAVNAIRSILSMLPPDDQHEALRQLTREHGMIQTDVPRMYSDQDVAERYGVHVRTARQWIVSGRLRGAQIAGRWYSRADWLNEFEIGQAPTG